MICPNCKQDIPESSDYCPECGTRQVHNEKKSSGMWKYIVLIVVMVLIVGTLYQALMNALDSSNSSRRQQTATQAETATPPPSRQPVMENTMGIEEDEEAKEEFIAQPEPQWFNPFDDDIIDVDIDDCHVEYLYHEIVQNMAGDWCVAVYYQFTNNSDSNQAFYVTVSDKAFQNGVELEDSLFHVNDDSKTRDMEIQPGVSVTVCSGFVLRDTSDVELQVSPWISFDNTPSDAMMLSLESEG